MQVEEQKYQSKSLFDQDKLIKEKQQYETLRYHLTDIYFNKLKNSLVPLIEDFNLSHSRTNGYQPEFQKLTNEEAVVVQDQKYRQLFEENNYYKETVVGSETLKFQQYLSIPLLKSSYKISMLQRQIHTGKGYFGPILGIPIKDVCLSLQGTQSLPIQQLPSGLPVPDTFYTVVKIYQNNYNNNIKSQESVQISMPNPPLKVAGEKQGLEKKKQKGEETQKWWTQFYEQVFCYGGSVIISDFTQQQQQQEQEQQQQHMEVFVMKPDSKDEPHRFVEQEIFKKPKLFIKRVAEYNLLEKDKYYVVQIAKSFQTQVLPKKMAFVIVEAKEVSRLQAQIINDSFKTYEHQLKIHDMFDTFTPKEKDDDDQDNVKMVQEYDWKAKKEQTLQRSFQQTNSAIDNYVHLLVQNPSTDSKTLQDLADPQTNISVSFPTLIQQLNTQEQQLVKRLVFLQLQENVIGNIDVTIAINSKQKKVFNNINGLIEFCLEFKQNQNAKLIYNQIMKGEYFQTLRMTFLQEQDERYSGQQQELIEDSDFV